MKLSEKSRRCPGRGLIRHPKGILRPVLAPEYWPNPCSERCSDPFSDSFITKFAFWAFSEVRIAPVLCPTPLRPGALDHPTSGSGLPSLGLFHGGFIEERGPTV